MNALLDEAKSSTSDHTKAPPSLEFEIPPAGPTPMRFIGYVETGKRPREYKGKEKTPALGCLLIFELNGKKHVREHDGQKISNVIFVRSTVQLGDKASFGKLFRAMRDGRAEITNMAQMLGEGFLGTVVHNETGEGDNKKTYANLRDAEGVWKIGPPRFVDPLDPDNVTNIPVPEITQPIRLLLWDNPSKNQWDSIFIDGTRTVKDEKGQEKEVSKNWIQEDILAHALDIEESALKDILAGLGDLNLKKEESKADPEAEAKAAAEKVRIAGEKQKAAERLAAEEAAQVEQEKAKAADKVDTPPPEEKAPPAATETADDVLKNLGF